MNCTVERDICFKSYRQGSYFGDLEVFSNAPRYFGVKAQMATTLLVIKKDRLEEVFKSFPECRVTLARRSLERMLKCNISLSRIADFGKITMKDKFWKKGPEISQRNLHTHILEFLGDLIKMKDEMSSE